MDLQNILLLSLLVYLTAVPQVCKSDPTFAAKNAKGEVIFDVLEQKDILMYNLRRFGNLTKLWITLYGSHIERTQVDSAQPNTWNFDMKDPKAVPGNTDSRATLQMLTDTEEIGVFEFRWFQGGPNHDRRACFHVEISKWYSTHQGKHTSWPIDQDVSQGNAYFNYLLDDRTYRAQDHSDYNTKEYRYIHELMLINSNGFAILFEDDAPLFMNRELDHDYSRICFSVNSTAPYWREHNLDLKFHIFMGKNIRTVTDYVVHKSGRIPRPTQVPREGMFEYTSWITETLPNQSQSGIEEFVNQLKSRDFRHSEIILPPNWKTGELKQNVKDYPRMDSLAQKLHHDGFLYGGPVNPSDETQWEQEEVRRYFLYLENSKDSNNPIKTPWIDFTQPDGASYFWTNLNKLYYDLRLNSFQLENYYLPNINELRLDAEHRQQPNRLLQNYLETSNQVATSITSKLAYRTQHLPFFVQLWYDWWGGKYDQEHYSKLLKVLLANTLSVSVAGYSNLIAYPISTYGGGLNEELYIRWAQASALMPRMAFFEPPWPRFGNNVTDIVRKYVDLHIEYTPTIVNLAKHRLLSGSPIIRPMWYAEPDDERAYTVGDQFMLGDNIVVAPVLVEGQRKRDVYLPKGLWEYENKNYEGGQVHKDIEARLDQLPFFKLSNSVNPTNKTPLPTVPTTKKPVDIPTVITKAPVPAVTVPTHVPTTVHPIPALNSSTVSI